MKTFDYLDIEKYLQGELQGQDLELFNQKLNNDADFAEEVSVYKAINNTLSSRAQLHKEENELRNTLEDLGKISLKRTNNSQSFTDKKKKTKVFTLSNVSKFLVAASLVMFTSLLFIQKGKPTYNDFATHQSMDLVVRGDSVSVFSEVQKAFNSKDYVLAENKLQKLTVADKTKVELQLYLGICMLEQDKFELAEKIFTKIKNGKSVYVNKAIWYLALSKLKQEDYENSTSFAKLIPKDADDYDKAQQLLKKL
ncbi:MAG: hypothetical protein V3U80_09315 [Flavobacteriaceae bacterium]